MILAVAAQKGGTGKTTTAAALAQAAATDGRKVLAVDMDAQANLSFFLGADRNAPGAYEMLHGTPAASVIQQTNQRIDTIAGSPDLATEKTERQSARRLEKALAPVLANYDLIVIDTPPEMGELTFNALQAADSLIITLGTEPGSLQGLYYTADIARGIQKTNKGLQILGALVTSYDGRPRINRAVLDMIRDACDELGLPYLGEIRQGVAIKEAQLMQRNLYKYAKKSNPAADYMAIYSALLARK